MQFEVAAKKVIEKLDFSPSDLNVCIKDANTVAQVFRSAFTKNNTLFGDIFAELNSTATFFKGNAVDLMPDFNFVMPFKLPFKVKPIFRYDNMVNLLRLKSKAKHAIIVDGYVSASKFHELLCSQMLDTINVLKIVTCGSNDDDGGPRVYQLSWHIKSMCDDIHGHKIKAEQQLNSKQGTPIVISFDFLPAFKFLIYENPLPNKIAEDVEGARYWIIGSAYIYGNTSIFSKVTPRWQLLKPQDKVMARNIIRLFTAFGKKHKEHIFLDVGIPKNSCFWLLQERETAFKTMPMMTLFLDIFKSIITNINSDLRPIIEALTNQQYMHPYKDIEEAYFSLKICQTVQYIQLDTMLEMFGLLDKPDGSPQ